MSVIGLSRLSDIAFARLYFDPRGTLSRTTGSGSAQALVAERPIALPPASGLECAMQSGFIASLPADSQSALEPLLTTVQRERGTKLFDFLDQIDFVWFPHTGTVVSLLIPLLEGQSIETGLVGHMGVVGSSAVANGGTALSTAMVQNGDALSSAPIERVRELIERDAVLRHRMNSHEQFLYIQAQQTAACNAVHQVETRLCRWLLQAREMAESDTLGFTQEFIGHILGVRRTTVTLIARHLQSIGFIKYSRGRIQLVDIPGLEEAACECHKTIKDQYDRLLVRRENAS
jgi:CRP-like cAMP-binding protein